jgi:hypothetical protein
MAAHLAGARISARVDNHNRGEMMSRWYAVAAVVAASSLPVVSAAAQSPDSFLHTANAAPRCASSGESPDPTVQVCAGFAFGGTRVALTTQSVLLNVGDAEANQTDCSAAFTTTTRTLEVDGQPLPITVVPCRYIPPADELVNPFFHGHWALFYRSLLDPGTLAPGTHTITFTTHWISDFTYSLNCPDPSGRCTVPAGSIEIDTGQLIIE